MTRLWIALFVFIPTLLCAQQNPVTGKERLAWSIVAPDPMTAQNYTYTLYETGGPIVGHVLAGVSCSPPPTAGGPIACSAPFPPFTPGAHTIAISAMDPSCTGQTALCESPKSDPFVFTFVVVPNTPTNLHIDK